MTDGNGCILPGNVYKYCCDNDQGYGYMVPVRTSDGWDFVDTYHLDIPVMKPGETSDEASARRIVELGLGEHDGYVSCRVSDFYYRNAFLRRKTVPRHLTLAFNLNRYDIVSQRTASDFYDCDIAMDVPLYRGQNFDWESGIARGLCFVRKGASTSVRHEFENACNDAMRSIVAPSSKMAAEFIGSATEMLRELEDRGLATPRDTAYLSHIARYERIISECCEDIARENDRYMLEVQEADHE